MNESPAAIIDKRYRLIDRISEGSHGEVWLGLDPDNAKVAVRILPRPGRPSASERVRRRFENEIAAGKQLHSASICRVLDFGELESLPELFWKNGVFYIICEYIEGGSLEDFLEDGKEFWLTDLREFVAHVCDALDTAHDHDPPILHCNIKPSTLLLRDGSLRNPKLVGFSLTRSNEASTLPAAGFGLDSWLFMAPEQLLSSSDIGPATDQYRLALVICELLTGEIPGRADDPYGALNQRQRGVDVSEIQVEGALAPAMRSVLQTAIAPHPSDRYSSIRDFAEAFDEAGIEDGLWDEEVRPSNVLFMEDMDLFVVDQRDIGGNLWVGGRAVGPSTLEMLSGTSAWSYCTNVQALNGASAYRLDGEAIMPWSAFQSRDESFAGKQPLPEAMRTPARSLAGRVFDASSLRTLIPSPELAKIVGNGPRSRVEIVQMLWGYIKRHDLQDKVNRREIHADDLLRPIVGGKARVSMFDLTKCVSRHLS